MKLLLSKVINLNADKKWSLCCQEEQRKATEGVAGKEPIKLGKCRQKTNSFNHKEASKLKENILPLRVIYYSHSSRNSMRRNQLKNNAQKEF